MTTVKHHELAKAEVLRCLDIARARYGFDAPVSMHWDVRGTKGGMARYASMSIHLNAHIAANEGEAYAQTVAHEVAHLVTYWRWQRSSFVSPQRRKAPRPHGLEWASVMAAFGKPAKRCHSYESATPTRTVARVFTYRCGCKDHTLTAIKHNRIVRGAKYRCIRCRQTLVLS